MKLEELANTEKELYSVVTSLGGTLKEKEKHLEKLRVFEEYYKVHQAYAQLHVNSLEALKRALFLSWYVRVEAPALTGIRELDITAEHDIIKTLDEKLKHNKIDYELEWMLSHYATWDAVFDDFEEYKTFQSRLGHTSVEMPAFIDHSIMKERGQMGIYWSFISLLG
ncbi:hypothetical protein [Pontibacter harenae]|uniref:hypothetical protein n=1 Tax=Pontibacter harenae TaxID=2894083 RepID=UPI001E44A5B3|nr:hypothetical protein [Pontibacter harenae]MCC9167165.1 hypothetical protein [Pontibacter harenae]